MRWTRLLPLLIVLLVPRLVGAQTQGQRAPRTRAIGSEAKNNQAAIRELYDRWSKAFRAHDIEGIMAVYAPGDAVVGYDIVGPLQYVGKDAYRKDYEVFLAQYVGPIVSSTATCASFRAVM